MKKNVEEKAIELSGEKIGRRAAMKKAAKYAAITSTTLLLVLSPKAHAEISEPGPVEPWPGW